MGSTHRSGGSKLQRFNSAGVVHADESSDIFRLLYHSHTYTYKKYQKTVAKIIDTTVVAMVDSCNTLLFDSL